MCFQALTSLHLRYVTFLGRADPFYAFPKLSTLEISHFEIQGEQNICISSSTLLNLTIQSYSYRGNIQLSTPNLCTFTFIGIPVQILPESYLSSVEHVDIQEDL